LVNLADYHTIVFDFDGVFTDNFLYTDSNGVESVRVSRADGYAIDLLKRYFNSINHKVSIFILSTETNEVVKHRAKKLKIECISGESNKLQVLTDIFHTKRPEDLQPFSGLIYFGNDLNDLPVMLKAGLSLAPSDAHPKIKKISTHTMTRPGGYEFVREGVEFLIGIESMSSGELSEFISNC
jgi:YrbI family 3-deoxy-D-manno-octulosonate 8-phosphate phosphatase